MISSHPERGFRPPPRAALGNGLSAGMLTAPRISRSRRTALRHRAERKYRLIPRDVSPHRGKTAKETPLPWYYALCIMRNISIICICQLLPRRLLPVSFYFACVTARLFNIKYKYARDINNVDSIFDFPSEIYFYKWYLPVLRRYKVIASRLRCAL